MRYVFLLMFGLLLAVPTQALELDADGCYGYTCYGPGYSNPFPESRRSVESVESSFPKFDEPKTQFLFTPDGRLGTITPFGSGPDPLQMFVLPDGRSGIGIPLGDGMYSIMPGPTFRDHLGLRGPPKNVPRGKRLMDFFEPW